MKICAFNQEVSSDEDTSIVRTDVKEERALASYSEGLRLQNEGSYDAALDKLRELFNEQIPQLECSSGISRSSIPTLKYSCCLNIGHLYLAKDDLNQALQFYSKASALDSSHVGLWYKVGTLALQQSCFLQAIHAFIMGLECNNSHWPCLDHLISLLYVVKDYRLCANYINDALQLDINYAKGIAIRSRMSLENPVLLQFRPSLYLGLQNKSDVAADRDVMQPVENLLFRIKEADDFLSSTPLQTLSLALTCSDFTWLSLGQEIVRLHQQISNEELSYFTLLEVVKTTSKHAKEPMHKHIHTIQSDSVNNSDNQEHLDAQTWNGRRMSHNSSENLERQQEDTPILVDEELTTELGSQCYEDLASQKGERHKAVKTAKRKRDLLSDLQIWGWHSKRKSFKRSKSERDVCVEDAIRRIIPNQLLNRSHEMNSLETDTRGTLNNDSLPIHPCQESEDYFNTTKENEAILQLIWRKTQYDITLLIKDFVLQLSTMWHWKWSAELIHIYTQTYLLYRLHYEHPVVPRQGRLLLDIKQDAMATLTYCELTHNLESDTPDTKDMDFLRDVSSRIENEENHYLSFTIRLYWLQAHVLIKAFNNESAVQALELIQDLIASEESHKKKKYVLLLTNYKEYNTVTMEIVDHLIQQLNMVKLINSVEDLYSLGQYEEVVKILKLTFANYIDWQALAKLDRTAQLAILLHSLWYTNTTDCFIFIEECLHEAVPRALNHGSRSSNWINILHKCFDMFKEIIKMESVVIVDFLPMDKRARLIGHLSDLICYQLNAEYATVLPLETVAPWILMYYILEREEHHQRVDKNYCHGKNDKRSNTVDSANLYKDDVPSSVSLLFTAHEYLGSKAWCLANNGELLRFMLDSLLDRLDTPAFECLRDKLDIHIEQALFCLYQHPSKKNKVSRHLADHNVDPLSLTWETAHQLFSFYGPTVLPEFDSYKNASISVDLEQLLQRIIVLVPSELDPLQKMGLLQDFITGKATQLPELMTFPTKMRNIYYLIGDFYFKQREFGRCIKCFMMDLCINNSRLDSWACIGLSYVSGLESKLNYCKKMKNEEEFLEKAKAARICFKKALDLDSHRIVLWIEFGSFEYMVHSFCSRTLKCDSDTLSMEKFEYLENLKEDYLESSNRSFNKAIRLYQTDESEADEKWLQYYMLGKIAEKQQKEPCEYLRSYVMAGQLLHENNASYPDKINYHNPQHLSVEALEMYYRLHASTLKYLELHSGEDINMNIGHEFCHYLDKTCFPKKILENKEPSTANVNKQVQSVSKENETVALAEVESCLEDLIKYVESNKKEAGSAQCQESHDSKEDVILISDSDEDVTQLDSHSKTVSPVVNEDRSDVCLTSHKAVFDSNASFLGQQSLPLIDDESYRKQSLVVPTDSTIKKDSFVERSSSSTSSAPSSTSDTDSRTDSSSHSSYTVHKTDANMSSDSIRSLLDRCIFGLEQCVIRLPQNYKALYRLAHVYYNSKIKKDLLKCKQLLLGEYTCEGGMVIPGLFSDRKNHNFFNGIWRIPSSDIDRPGSLSAHMCRCVTLLLQVLRDIGDNRLLLEISMQLQKNPDPDKIYIQESERLQFSEQALTMCIQCLRGRIQNAKTNADLQKLLAEIFKYYRAINKGDSAKGNAFEGMLAEVYRKLENMTANEHVNLAELTAKLSQQSRSVERVKRQSQEASALKRPGILTPCALPTSTHGGPEGVKKMGIKRPRGRPPLSRKPEDVSIPSSYMARPFSWEPSAYSYDSYLKHYQDQLIKQYNLSQLTQLNEYLSGGSHRTTISDHVNTNIQRNPRIIDITDSDASLKSSSGNINQKFENPRINTFSEVIMKKLPEKLSETLIPWTTESLGVTGPSNLQSTADAENSSSPKISIAGFNYPESSDNIMNEPADLSRQTRC